jgi:hypothetical protein
VTDETPRPEDLLPLRRRELTALTERVRVLETRLRRNAELLDDLRLDGARFLRQRGASEAQVERLEDAVRRHLAELREAEVALREAVDALER